MRLDEIKNQTIDGIPIQPITTDSFREINRMLGRNEMTKSGGHTGAYLYPQSNSAIKISPLKEIDRAMTKFVALGMKHSNPFVPVVYRAVIYKLTSPSRMKYYLLQETEYLHELNTIDESTVKMLFDQLGLKVFPRNVNRMFYQPGVLDQAVKQTKNENFKQAIKVLKPLINKYGPDAKNDNWMIRLTKNGPQLVMMDPILPASCSDIKLVQEFTIQFEQLDRQFNDLEYKEVLIIDVIPELMQQMHMLMLQVNDSYGSSLKSYNSAFRTVLCEKAPKQLISTLRTVIRICEPLMDQISKAYNQFKTDKRFTERIRPVLDEYQCFRDVEFLQHVKRILSTCKQRS